jgi:hypothetical protein
MEIERYRERDRKREKKRESDIIRKTHRKRGV